MSGHFPANTLAIFSFLYKDNPIYKAVESLAVGLSAGYFTVLLVRTSLMRTLIDPLKEGNVFVIMPALLGIMMYFRLSRKLTAGRGRWSAWLGLVVRAKTDSPSLRHRTGTGERLDHSDKRQDLHVMVGNLLFELLEFLGELLARAQHMAQSYEGPNNEDADLYRALGIQNAGRHDGTVFGVREGESLREFQRGKVVAICYHLRFLRRRQAKHEVDRKTAAIAFYLLVQAFCRNAVDSGENGVYDDLLAPDEEDPLLNGADLYQRIHVGLRHPCACKGRMPTLAYLGPACFSRP